MRFIFSLYTIGFYEADGCRADIEIIRIIYLSH